MHRPLVIAALVLLMASVPLSAQHGGGHASGGGHGFGGGGGGFASHGGFGGHASGGHAFTGMRSSPGSAGHSFARGSTFNRPLSSRGFNRRLNHSGVGVRIRTFGFGNNCYGYGCGYGYGYPYYPYLGGGVDPDWWSSDSSSAQDQQDQTGLANQMNQQGDQDAYARSAPPPLRQEERTDPAPATVLVFHDQHSQEVRNYAIVGQTLWVFTPQRTQKIALADLDIPATIKVNDDRGVDFRLPGVHEGQ